MNKPGGLYGVTNARDFYRAKITRSSIFLGESALQRLSWPMIGHFVSVTLVVQLYSCQVPVAAGCPRCFPARYQGKTIKVLRAIPHVSPGLLATYHSSRCHH